MRSYSITLISTNFQNNNQLPRLHCNFLVLMLYHITHLECYLLNLYYKLLYIWVRMSKTPNKKLKQTIYTKDKIEPQHIHVHIP